MHMKVWIPALATLVLTACSVPFNLAGEVRVDSITPASGTEGTPFTLKGAFPANAEILICDVAVTDATFDEGGRGVIAPGLTGTGGLFAQASGTVPGVPAGTECTIRVVVEGRETVATSTFTSEVSIVFDIEDPVGDLDPPAPNGIDAIRLTGEPVDDGFRVSLLVVDPIVAVLGWVGIDSDGDSGMGLSIPLLDNLCGAFVPGFTPDLSIDLEGAELSGTVTVASSSGSLDAPVVIDGTTLSFVIPASFEPVSPQADVAAVVGGGAYSDCVPGGAPPPPF